MYKSIKTLGDLKKLIEEIREMNDNTPLLQYKNDMEKSGYFPGILLDIGYYKKQVKDTWDRFDGGSYSYEVYRPIDNIDKLDEEEKRNCIFAISI